MRPYPYLRKEKAGIKTKKRFITLLLIGVMLLSVGGFIAGYQNSGATSRYKGIKFTQGAQYIEAKINDKYYSFSNFPQWIESVHLEPEIGPMLTSTRMLYISYDPNATDAEQAAMYQYDLKKAFEHYHPGVFVQIALTSQNQFNLPVISCENATDAVPVLVLQEGSGLAIYQQNNCVVAEYRESQDLPVIRDVILLAAEGVLP